jgi:NAD(P)-dependent dehydrogenase (short-subunit alcohol dehydrogenase family)
LYDIVKEQKGRINILFADAALGNLYHWGRLPTHFDKTFGVNVKGLLFTVQKALPIFQVGGSIILNASIAASTGVGP